jgi:hypothetical protein
VKIFRHQPLLVWTLVLTVLLTVLAVGALAGGDATESRAVVPLAQTGASAAEELLRRLPGVHATIEAGTYPAWIEDYAAYARAEAAEHRAENPQAWNSVVAAASAAENVDPQARPVLLGAVENLNSAVFALVRSYR